MQAPSLFLPAPFAILPGAFAEFHREMSAEKNPVTLASEHYHQIPRADTWEDYATCQANKKLGLQLDPATGIAIQPLIGRIMHGISPEWEAWGGWFNSERIIDAARRTLTDTAVKALVLYIQSPGGYSTANRECAAALASITGKPVLAWFEYAGSAAMFIAAGAQQRHAPSYAELGSIGTFIVTRDNSQFYAMNGWDIRLFNDGKFKAIGAEGVAWSREWYDYVAARVAESGKEFKDFIRAACPLVPDELMEGQSYPASALRNVNAVGPGHLIDSCPDDSGANGFPTFDDLLESVIAAL